MNPAATQPAAETVARAPLGRVPDPAAMRAFERLLGEARTFDPLAETLRHDARPGTEAGAHEAAGDPGCAPGAAPTVPPASTPAASASTADVRELYEVVARLVEQLYVSRPDAARDPTVLMRLDAALFPGTELALARDARGWRLDAQSASPDVHARLAGAAGELAARFAARGLGDIRIAAHPAPTGDTA